jgi:Cu/Ag efflux protein CusF
MRKRRLLPVLFAVMAATAASAQPGGGGHGHGGGGGGGSGGGPGPSAPRRAQTPVNQLQIVGVVKAIDTTTGRITIAYEPVEALNWPSGTQPFPVAKTALLNGVTVDEKVRFTLDSGEIATLKPF